MITEEMIAEDEKRWNNRNIVAELGYCGKNIFHRKNITNNDIRFYAYIMRKAHAMLKEQEPVIETLKSDLRETLAVLGEQPEIVRCRECKYGEYVCSGAYECRSPAAVKKVYAQFHKPEWFCADGERKQKDG